MKHFNFYDYKILLNKFGISIRELDINAIEQFRGNERREPFVYLKDYSNKHLIDIHIEEKENEDSIYYKLEACIYSDYLLNKNITILDNSIFNILNTYSYFYKNIFKDDFQKNQCTIFSKFHNENNSTILLELNYSDLDFCNLLSVSYNSRFLDFIDNYLNNFSIKITDYQDKDEKAICDLIKVITY